MNGNGCLVAFYHYVRDVGRTPFPDLKALAVRDFIAQLEWFARHRRIVSHETFLAQMETKSTLDGTALLTFDDGFVDHYETVFPELSARKWSGVFFLSGQTLDAPPRVLNVHKTHFLVAALGAHAFADAVTRALSEDPESAGTRIHRRAGVYRYDEEAQQDVKHLLNYELPFSLADRVLDDLFAEYLGDQATFARRLYLAPHMITEMSAAGMTFGFHTESHRVLSRLDVIEQRRELAAGVERVRRLTGQSAVPFCYPYGHPHTYTTDTIAILAEFGYSTAFNTVRRCANPQNESRFEVPRYDTRDLPPFTTDGFHA